MSIIFIGKEFKYRNFLQNYIISQKKGNIYFFDKLDFEVEKILENETLIITNEKYYSTISKMLATLNDDILELKNDTLIPSQTIVYEKNSYLLSLNEKLINVIKITDYIPNILLSNEINTIHIFNYDLESTNLFVKSIFESFNIKYSIYMNEGGWCEINFDKLNQNLLKQLRGFIPNLILTNNIFEYIKIKLEEKNEKITFAESCTGGLIASYFTKVAGSSSIFDGSVVSYANRIKSEWLGVDARVLEKFGAVSEETIQQMLLGILEISNSDYAIAVSGIAGPSGGSETKPVGTVYIGVGDKKGKFMVERLQLNGDRIQIQYQTMMNAIRIFIKFTNLF